MPKKDLSHALPEVTFHCRPSNYTFKAEPARIQDDPDQEHHPFQYFAQCSYCSDEAPQAQHERSLLKAWANATGPRTAEGKAATARNLEGHPTPEEALRTRFNAMKHGLCAQEATYFPAPQANTAAAKPVMWTEASAALNPPAANRPSSSRCTMRHSNSEIRNT